MEVFQRPSSREKVLQAQVMHSTPLRSGNNATMQEDEEEEKLFRSLAMRSCEQLLCLLFSCNKFTFSSPASSHEQLQCFPATVPHV